MIGRTDNTAFRAPAGVRGWPRRGGGFTLIEMLVVVVMISILAGSVVVCLRGRRGSYALGAAAGDLAGAIRFAASEARIRQSPHRVVFDAELKSYRVEAARPGAAPGFVPVKGLAGLVRPLLKGVRIASVFSAGRRVEPAPASLEFLPDGEGFSGLIEMQSDNGQLIRIEVMRETGQVRLRR